MSFKMNGKNGFEKVLQYCTFIKNGITRYQGDMYLLWAARSSILCLNTRIELNWKIVLANAEMWGQLRCDSNHKTKLSFINSKPIKKTHHHPLAFRPELPPPLPINAAIPKAKNGCGTSQKAAFEFLQINIPW